MRRRLEDWEAAEALATPYAREQVERFSPRSKAILEIQSRRDLEILEKIYANSVLLGDDGPDGWGITYATEFHMTNDSKLFPRGQIGKRRVTGPTSTAAGSKVSGGRSRSCGASWKSTLRASCRPTPNASAVLQRRTCSARRADVPAGIVLSREGMRGMKTDAIEEAALPLYEGRMVSLFDYSEKGWGVRKGQKGRVAGDWVGS